VVGLLACYQFLRERLWRLHGAWRWLPFLFFIGFAPVSAALIQGQDSILTLLFLTIAFLNLESGSDFLAGFMVGLAAYKFQLVLPIGCLFLVWGRWRFVCGTCLSTIAAVIASAFIVGTQTLLSYPSYLRETAAKFAIMMPADRMPNFRGLISLLHMHAGANMALVLGLSLAVMGVAWWSGRNSSAEWQFSIALSAAALVGYHVMTHDLSILLIPMAVLLAERGTIGLWVIPTLWFSTALCFFGYGPFVALPLLALFLCLAVRLLLPVVELSDSSPLEQSSGSLA
jgi:hypothetical protein